MPDSGLDPGELVRWVIRPVLTYLDPEIPFSVEACRIVLGTAIHESRLRYLDQLSNDPSRPGPAFGLWQMEGRTLADHLAWVERDAALAQKIDALRVQWPVVPAQLQGNLYFACALCRVHYRRAPEPIIGATTAELGRLWKLRYNSPLGAGSVADGVEAMRHAEQWV